MWYRKNKCCRFVVVCSFYWGKKIFVAGASQGSRLQAFNFLKCLRAMIVFTVMITSVADTVIGPQSGNVHFAHGPWNLKACCFVNDQGSAGPMEQITVSSREKQVFSRITGRAKWGSKDRQGMSAWVKQAETYRKNRHAWMGTCDLWKVPSLPTCCPSPTYYSWAYNDLTDSLFLSGVALSNWKYQAGNFQTLFISLLIKP